MVQLAEMQGALRTWGLQYSRAHTNSPGLCAGSSVFKLSPCVWVQSLHECHA